VLRTVGLPREQATGGHRADRVGVAGEPDRRR
jgi:hypothetical protein